MSVVLHSDTGGHVSRGALKFFNKCVNVSLYACGVNMCGWDCTQRHVKWCLKFNKNKDQWRVKPRQRTERKRGRGLIRFIASTDSERHTESVVRQRRGTLMECALTSKLFACLIGLFNFIMSNSLQSKTPFSSGTNPSAPLTAAHKHPQKPLRCFSFPRRATPSYPTSLDHQLAPSTM